MNSVLNTLSILFIPAMLTFILGYGMIKRAPIYDYFIEGAKEGLQSAVEILPFIIAIFVGIESLVSSGAMDFFENLMRPLFERLGIPEGLISLILLRPVSGSGALVNLQQVLESSGADGLTGRAASVMMGSCETIFYVLALYFGVTKVKQIRHALPVGIITYIAGVFLSVWICSYI
ncbi:spore maturation protein [Sinanaerobacter sp. ZZT-01]|uniref:spore maturation protein n=1 Tax=Sinanaerobacter sp. ZZT-01 TaxID=3111540 RepID=UPI002D7743AB|nr:nucleoside recognition domain-containing protein [Sinanaerobacter sp. ZZT-01]WRR92208.1 nucleoside recognition domain-containing protein [Sinanaerobacter sp. ZZT-01]